MTDSLADPHLRVPAATAAASVRDIVILGSTGSIGTQAIDVVLRNPDRFRVTGLSAAGGRAGLLAEQAHRLRVDRVAVARPEAVAEVRQALSARYGAGESLPEILAGPDAATELARSQCHTVLNGITGSIGLAPTLAALEAGRVLALANKESLIVGGPLVKAVAKPGQIVPVDSEHSALFQALLGGAREEVRKLVVTASGGPFRGRTKRELASVTPEQALAHPTWDMGPVITINSATLVNKGLEVIEAHLLYDIPFERIEVVVHPQSYIHSMVEFTDGSTLAQASPPDMRMPIALGLGWPERVPDAAPGCDWTKA
ncbi:1-deoxy-D-xylulose-5-phosphate reductoisomerase, partial [Streptomyces albiflaviniger]|nr:1-deoxy-D-xylulose-5-phosphate reductoisomerase [Streptomyces albiflaviniger]